MVVCVVLLSVVAAVLVPGIHAVHEQRKATRFETLSLIELNNQAVRLRSVSNEQLKLSEWFQSRYPQASLQATLLDQKDDSIADLRPLQLTITQSQSSERPPQQETLVVWVTSGQEGQ